MGGIDNRLEYEKRVNRVVDHIQKHLGEELSLAALARVALFSRFHFHRVFRALRAKRSSASSSACGSSGPPSRSRSIAIEACSRSRWTTGSPPPRRSPARSSRTSG
jgi:hypothetical protein